MHKLFVECADAFVQNDGAPGREPGRVLPCFISPIWGVADYSATSSVAVSSVSATARA